jgi:hypothetical protein
VLKPQLYVTARDSLGTAFLAKSQYVSAAYQAADNAHIDVPSDSSPMLTLKPNIPCSELAAENIEHAPTR